MMEIGVKSFEEWEFFHGFPKVVEHLCLWVKVSDAAKYVVVSLCYFGVIAAGVWSKQEFDQIFLCEVRKRFSATAMETLTLSVVAVEVRGL